MTAFPQDLPDDLDEPARIWEHDWSAFTALDHMDTHWRRPGWTPGRRSYHWMLTFDDDSADHVVEVERYVEQIQRAVPAEGFDLVAAGSVHLTLGRIGFVDETPQAVALEVVAHAEGRGQRPSAFTLRLGPVSGSRGAVRLSVSPWTPLLTLHAFLAAATQDVLGRWCVMDTAAFRPHVGIAYANTRVPAPEIVSVLEPLRGLRGPQVRVRSVSLVELERVDRSYRHRTLRRLALNDDARVSTC